MFREGVTERTVSITTTEFIEKMAYILSERPKLVLTMTESNDKMTNLDYDQSIWFPWIVLTNSSKVAITCAGRGTTHHGLWRKTVSDKARGTGSFTKNLQNPLCCDKIRGGSLTIGYDMSQFEYDEQNWKLVDKITIDSSTYHGFLMDTYIKGNQIKPTFHHADHVHFEAQDIDVLVLKLDFEPGGHYVFPLHYEKKFWVMKAPGKVPPYFNLINTMDLGSWISVPVSLVSVTLALVIIVRVGRSYGIPQPDLVRIILTPFAMLNHEEMPAWFEFPHSQVNRIRSLVVIDTTMRLVRRGRAGNLLLLVWSYMGMIIMFGFTCNLRAIYMQENYEEPLDTAEQIYKSNKTFYSFDSRIDWLKTLDNPWYTKLANRAVMVAPEELSELSYKIPRDDNLAMIGSDSWMAGLSPSTQRRIHVSKELITSLNMKGWRVQKMSPWQQSLYTHILQLDQVLTSCLLIWIDLLFAFLGGRF